MRILDQNGIEVVEPDLELGHLVEETILIEHHDAVPETPRVVTRKLVSKSGDAALFEKVVTQPYVPAKPAWDETETIKRYVLYTADELAQREAENAAREAAIEAENAAREAAAALQAEREAFADAAPDALIEISEKLDAVIDALAESDPANYAHLKEDQDV